MRKIFFAACVVIFFASVCYGAVSNDTQLILSRLDALNQRIEDFQKSTDDKFAAVNQRIDDKIASVNQRIDDLQASTAAGIAAVSQRMDDRFDVLMSVIAWGLGALGILIAWITLIISLLAFKNSRGEKESERNNSFSLNDVLALFQLSKEFKKD